MNDKTLIEICVNSVQSAVEAQKGGAHRVELCDNMYEGGTTPSYGSIETARKYLKIGINVMIRPRGGDFCYSDLEFEIMKNDIETAKKLKADGIVFGILKPNGSIDIERSREILHLAKPLSVTCHRAFDMTADPFQALDELIDLGVNRVLTSGQRASAWEGSDLIAQLVQKAKNHIIIMPGVDIFESNIQQLAAKTQATEYHVFVQKKIESRMTFRNFKAFMGSNPDLPEYETFITDPDRVRAICNLMKI